MARRIQTAISDSGAAEAPVRCNARRRRATRANSCHAQIRVSRCPLHNNNPGGTIDIDEPVPETGRFSRPSPRDLASGSQFARIHCGARAGQRQRR